MKNKDMIPIAGVTSVSHPTVQDLTKLMEELRYGWSNQAQVYYYAVPCPCFPRHDDAIQTIDRVTARHIYKTLIGDKTYSPINQNNI